MSLCDKICELEAYIEHLTLSLTKPFANKVEIKKQIDEANSDLKKYQKFIMEVPDVKKSRRKKTK